MTVIKDSIQLADTHLALDHGQGLLNELTETPSETTTTHIAMSVERMLDDPHQAFLVSGLSLPALVVADQWRLSRRDHLGKKTDHQPMPAEDSLTMSRPLQ
jgi:hypothetical protein